MGWLYRITTNLCLSGMRDRNRRRQILDRWAPRPANAVVPATDSALTVRALLRDIPDDLQELAIYYFVDDMSQAEIAALTGIPRRTIGYRLEQFRSRIQAIEAATSGEALAVHVDIDESDRGRSGAPEATTPGPEEFRLDGAPGDQGERDRQREESVRPPDLALAVHQTSLSSPPAAVGGLPTFRCPDVVSQPSVLAIGAGLGIVHVSSFRKAFRRAVCKGWGRRSFVSFL